MHKHFKKSVSNLLVFCIMVFLFSAIHFSSVFAISTAKTYYVSPNGNDNNQGTISAPLKSLNSAASLAEPGDTVYLRDGTHQLSSTVKFSKKATQSNPIKVLAYLNEKPVLDFSSFKPATENERFYARGFFVDGNYYYFKGFEICNSPDNGVKLEGAHNTFEQCVFHHNGDSGIQIGLQKDTISANPDPENLAAYNNIINCDSYKNADPATDYENADGFACKLYAGKGNYFYGCRAWENCDDGWDCYQTNYEIVIENCWAFHNGDPSIWGFTAFNGDGNGFKLGGNDAPCPITIKNSVAFDSPYGAMCGFNDNNNGSAVTVLNCTAWACGKDFKLKDQAHVLKNNIAFDPKSGARFTNDLSSTAISVNNTWNLSTVTADYNDFISTSKDDALAPRESDGRLPNNGFAKLKDDSDLIDKGVDVGLPYVSSSPDLGAYEFGLNIIPTVTGIISTPTNTVPTNTQEVVYGDVSGDGRVDSADYQLMRKYLLHIISALPGSNWQVAGDLNGDGVIDPGDYLLMKRFLLGIIKVFPVNSTSIMTPTPTPNPTITKTPT